MRQPPVNRIAPDAVKAWRITAGIGVAILWVLTIALLVLAGVFNFSYWFGGAAAILSGVSTVVTVFLLPVLRWRRWRYEVFDQEIYIQHGILIVSQTIVPMIRVQHVDTRQGPVLKRYDLATLEISTAATTHEIPALLEGDASDLRDRISALARVDEDDV